MQFTNGFEAVDSVELILAKAPIEPMRWLEDCAYGLSFIATDIDENFHVINKSKGKRQKV